MRLEPRAEGMVNTCEPSINVVNVNEPKGLTGSDQNGMRTSMEVGWSSIADVVPSAKRWDLRLRVTVIERNLVNLYLSLRESEPQGEPMGMQVADVGKSECSSVMGEIGLCPARKSADFRLVWNHKIV
jgi:hypothetical protein